MKRLIAPLVLLLASYVSAGELVDLNVSGGLSSTDEISVATIDVGTGTIGGITIYTSSMSAVYDYIQSYSPDQVEGSSCTFFTDDDTSEMYGRAVYQHAASSEANHCTYNISLPPDFDPGTELRIEYFYERLNGIDVSSRVYVLAHQPVGTSEAIAGTFVNPITHTVEADASGTTGDLEISASGGVTLTGWADALSAGDFWRIRIHRDGDAANDVSTSTSTLMGLAIRYGKKVTF